jgi:MoaA/NifB/PqqE/SkfB family radical SAM enzyme
MDVAIDYRCTMKCEHCFAVYSLKGSAAKKLSLGQYRAIASEAADIGCLHVNLQGGEPLLIADLTDYVGAFQPGRCHVSITTNGVLFDTEWARRLRRAGVKQVVFSLDSLDAAEHDRFRNLPGAYDKVLAGIALARRAGFSVTVNVAVSHESLRDKNQRDLFGWLERERIPYNPILACPVGGWRGRTDLLVSETDVQEINHWRQRGFAQRDIDASWVRRGCSAAAEQVYLTPYGDVLPCPFIQISLGNLHEERLQAIWRRAAEKGWFGRYAERCWVAEDPAFARVLNDLYSRFDDLPVPFTSDEGRKFLDEHWGARRSKKT